MGNPRNIHEPYQAGAAHGTSLRVVISLRLATGLPVEGFRFFGSILTHEKTTEVKFILGRRRIKSVVTNHFGRGIRDMKKVALDELINTERHCVPFGSIGVLVREGHSFAGQGDDPSVRDGSASDITGHIDEDALSVIIPVLNTDVPLCTAEFVLEILPPLEGHLRGKVYHALLGCLIYVVEELSSEYHHDCLDGEKISLLPCFHPSHKIEAALGDQAMNMGMKDHGLAPGMECCDDAWFSSDVLLIEEELEERVSYGGKEKISHGPNVQDPQVVEFMGEGKDHMVMGAGNDSLFLFFKPLFYANPVTLGTEAVTAGVIPLSLIMALGTCLDMPSKLCSPAFDKGFHRLADIQRDKMGLLIRFVMVSQYLLDRGFHRRLPITLHN